MTAEYLRERLSEASLVLSEVLSKREQLREIVAEARTAFDRCRTIPTVGEQDFTLLINATERVNALLKDPNGRLKITNVDVLIADWKFHLGQARIWIERYRDVGQLSPSTSSEIDRVRYAYSQFLTLMLSAKDARSTLAEVCRLRKDLNDLRTEALSLPVIRTMITSSRTKLETRERLSRTGTPERA